MRTPVILLAVIALHACGADFAPYNRLEGLRVLALQSEPASPAFGETATLSALVYAPPGEPVELSWSWCPFTAGAFAGYACAVDEAELQAAIDESLPPGVTFTLPPFDLGSAETASLTHVFVPELLTGACREVVAGGLPPGVSAPDCAAGLPVTIRLEARAAGVEVVAVKELLLRGTGEPANANPTIAGLFAVEPGTGETSVAADGSTTLARDREVELNLELDASQAEPYVGADGQAETETLVFTWFVEAGDTEVTRTALAVGRAGLDQARRNTWTTPDRAALARSEAQLFIVVRDGRGGVGWLARRVQLRGE